MLTIVAFIVALALLIAVHEYGHYRVAVACGVKKKKKKSLYRVCEIRAKYIRLDF